MDPNRTISEHVIARLLDGTSAGEAEGAAEARARMLIDDLRRAASIDPLFETDRAAVARLAESTRPAPGLVEAAGRVVRRWVAALAEDSWTGALAGYRGGSGGRRLVFRCEAGDIELGVSTTRPGVAGVVPGEVSVSGCVGPELAGGQVRALGLEGDAGRADIGPDGFFELTLKEGEYEFEMVGPSACVSIPRMAFSATEAT